MTQKSSKSARAFWVAEPKRGEIRPEPLPEIGPGDVLVRAQYGAISRGTETLIYNGRAPQDDLNHLWNPFVSGQFPAPVKFGQSVVGRVENGPEEMIGKAVFCAHPHQTRCVVPLDSVRPIPDYVPVSRAVLAHEAETAINTLWDAQIALGMPVSVVGAGVFGCLIGFVAKRITGGTVEVVDIDIARMPVVNALGLTFKTPDDAAGDRQVVVNASGSGEGLSVAADLARRSGRVVDASWYADRTPMLSREFHRKSLTLMCSSMQEVSASAAGWADESDRFRHAMSVLADPDIEVLFTRDIGFEDLPEAMKTLTKPGNGAFCTRITYPY